MLILAMTFAAAFAVPVCDGVSTREVFPATAGTWCPVAQVHLGEHYCDGSQPEVCQFLQSLPQDVEVRCIQEAAASCAVTVARDGDRRFYALNDSPTIRALADQARWAVFPVSLARNDDGTYWFDPRDCPGCAYVSPQLQLLQQHGLPSNLKVLDENVTFNARTCTLSAEVPRAGAPPARVASISLGAAACASETAYWAGDSGS